MDKVGIMANIAVKLRENPFLLFDETVDMPSLNNSIKEFSYYEPIWEDMSDDDIELENASEDDLENLLYEIERQLEKDQKIMEHCRGGW